MLLTGLWRAKITGRQNTGASLILYATGSRMLRSYSGRCTGDLTQLYSIPFWLTGTLAIFGSLMVSYTRARAEAAGASASVGFADRPVRMIILIVGAFIDMVNFAILLNSSIFHS